MNNTNEGNTTQNISYQKISLYIFAFVTVALFGVFLSFSIKKAYTLYPGLNDFYYAFYNDSLNGGNSRINRTEIADSVISFDFDLKEGFLSPYVGMTLSPKENSAIDLSQFNQLTISASGENLNNIGISVFTQKPKNQPSINTSEMCFHTNLPISSSKKVYQIPLSQFKLPDWWRDLHNIAPNNEISPNFSQVLHVNIGTGYTPDLQKPHNLKIYQISFSRNNTHLALLLLIIEAATALTLGAIYLLRRNRPFPNEPVTITYKPVDVTSEPTLMSGFLDFINQNFHNSELNLEQVADNTGISTRKITNVIQEKFGCNFKTYVNQIRINEAKRLLNETELTMGDIAFKIGFSNQSHFNRVFKGITGTSPSQFRQQK